MKLFSNVKICQEFHSFFAKMTKRGKNTHSKIQTNVRKIIKKPICRYHNQSMADQVFWVELIDRKRWAAIIPD